MKSNPKPWLYGADWQGLRCGARTRSGSPCKRPGNKTTGKCKLHGGRSTGPKTPEGLERIIKSRTTHGNFSKDRRERARQFAKHGRQLRAELKELENWFVNHGYLDRNWRAKFQ